MKFPNKSSITKFFSAVVVGAMAGSLVAVSLSYAQTTGADPSHRCGTTTPDSGPSVSGGGTGAAPAGTGTGPGGAVGVGGSTGS